MKPFPIPNRYMPKALNCNSRTQEYSQVADSISSGASSADARGLATGFANYSRCHVIIVFYLVAYLVAGLYTELVFAATTPIPDKLFEDFRYYARALTEALNGGDPYAIRAIGPAFLYPPPALFAVEMFNHIEPFLLRVSIYSVFNIALLLSVVYGVARYYNYSVARIWWWYVLCLGFAPFLELLHIGQINLITLFGLFVLFVGDHTSPLAAGLGLALATATKVTPLAYVPYLLANRKFKALGATIGFLALLVCVGALRYGLSPTLEYVDVFEGLLNQFVIDANSQSLVAKLAMLSSYPQLLDIISALPAALRTPITGTLGFLTFGVPVIQRALALYVLVVISTSCILTVLARQPKEPSFVVTGFAMMLAPNIMWYHHYVFILLPLLIWMGWRRLDGRVVAWSLFGLLIIQVDRYFPPYGLMIHIFGHVSMLSLLFWQVRHFDRVSRNVPRATDATS